MPTYHRTGELCFGSYDTLEVALESPLRQAPVACVPEFASAGNTSFLAEVTEAQAGREETEADLMRRRPSKGRPTEALEELATFNEKCCYEFVERPLGP